MTRPKTTALLLVVLTLIAVPFARAQAPDLSDRLPAGTLFYVYWRGTNSISAGNRNEMVELWNDPGFAPARHMLEQGVATASRNPHLAAVPLDELQVLFGRPFVFGARLVAPGPSAGSGAVTRVRGFLVAEAPGEAGESLRSALAKVAPQAASHVGLTSTGFLVAASDPATLRDLTARFGAAPPPSPSLSGVAAYRDARAELAGRPSIEFFLRIPPVSALGAQSRPNFRTTPFLQALHLDRVHALCGGIDMNTPGTMMHFSILGDTAPGSLFDLFGANAPTFATLAAAPAGASFDVYRMDLGALVELVSNALSAAVSQEDAGRVKMIGGMFSSIVLPSLAGEYATVWPPTIQAGTGPQPLVAVSIHRQAADQLFASTFAGFVKPAGQDGAISYFSTAPGGSRPPASANGNPQGKPAAPSTFFVALTPNLLLASQDEALVRRAAHTATAPSPASGGLATESGFRAARAELPAELSGLAYIDMARLHWTEWLKQFAATMARNKSNPHRAERARELEQWADGDGGAVLAEHLHWFVAGSWKDSAGVHWRGEIH